MTINKGHILVLQDLHARLSTALEVIEEEITGSEASVAFKVLEVSRDCLNKAITALRNVVEEERLVSEGHASRPEPGEGGAQSRP